MMAIRSLFLIVFASAVSLQLTIARSADDPIAATSIGRFAIEAFDLPFQERVDLCSSQYPALKPALSTMIADLHTRYVALLVQELKTEQFASLVDAEVPQSLFALNRGQSAMRREVNTRTTEKRCKMMLAEYPGISDQILLGNMRLLLTSTKSTIDSRKTQSAK
jgi:hypothetical protein